MDDLTYSARNLVVACLGLATWCAPSIAQRVDIPDYVDEGYVPGWTPTSPLQPVFPQAPPGYSAPAFDPYGGGGPYGPGSNLSAPVLGPFDTIAPTLPPGVALPGAVSPSPGFDAYSGTGASPAGGDAFPTYNGSPGEIPYGTSLYDANRGWDQWWNEQPVRFATPRFQYAWIKGGDGLDVDINDSDISVVYTWPNFLGGRQPLYIAPSYSLHLWDGPQPTPEKQADLPPRAYSAFLDVAWASHPDVTFGGELGVRLGVFSDFDELISQSLRIMGKALFRIRRNEQFSVRGGVYYVNRVNVKLLPAFGVTWTPNPGSRYDIMFPNPKFAKYLATNGSYDIWWYLAGEYGGGVWTVRRTSGEMDVANLNDIRVILGFEWGRPDQIRNGRRFGFFEAAWVLNRQLNYQFNPQDDIGMPDTFMLRAGIGY